MRPIDADSLKPDMIHEYNTLPAAPQYGTLQRVLGVSMEQIAKAPTIEPNLILPERMERGDIYEVGETIVVMNHDDYYDLLCKSWVPKRGEWIPCSERLPSSSGKCLVTEGVEQKTTSIGFFSTEHKRFYSAMDVIAWMPLPEPYCGARMKGKDNE